MADGESTYGRDTPQGPGWAKDAFFDGRAGMDAPGVTAAWNSVDGLDLSYEGATIWAFPVTLKPGEGHPDDVMGCVMWGPYLGLMRESETRLELCESLRCLGLGLGERPTKLSVADRALWRAVGDLRGVLFTPREPTAATLATSQKLLRDAQADTRIYEALNPRAYEVRLMLLRARVLGDAWLRHVTRGSE